MANRHGSTWASPGRPWTQCHGSSRPGHLTWPPMGRLPPPSAHSSSTAQITAAVLTRISRQNTTAAITRTRISGQPR